MIECETARTRLGEQRNLIVAVVGPTASGKSDLALDLAQLLPQEMGAKQGELVSADALQLYRGMDIGTAKTPFNERRGIPHHQIDVLDISDEASVAAYQKYAREDIAQIHARSNLAVVAGGSGLYQRALLDHLDFPGTDTELRSRLEEESRTPGGVEHLFARLEELDPLSASRIDAHNARRIIRALEVIELTGKPYSSSMPQYVYAAPAVMVALRWPLEELDQRIWLRTQVMFEQGLVEETRELDKQGLRAAKTAAKATGYAQALAVIDGELATEQAIDSVALATRQLARRQMKWLRRDPRIVWIDRSSRETSMSAEAALSLARETALRSCALFDIA